MTRNGTAEEISMLFPWKVNVAQDGKCASVFIKARVLYSLESISHVRTQKKLVATELQPLINACSSVSSLIFPSSCISHPVPHFINRARLRHNNVPGFQGRQKKNPPKRVEGVFPWAGFPTGVRYPRAWIPMPCKG
jgi:hypothetical protein